VASVGDKNSQISLSRGVVGLLCQSTFHLIYLLQWPLYRVDIWCIAGLGLTSVWPLTYVTDTNITWLQCYIACVCVCVFVDWGRCQRHAQRYDLINVVSLFYLITCCIASSTAESTVHEFITSIYSLVDRVACVAWMRPTATDVARSVVCVSVWWWLARVYQMSVETRHDVRQCLGLSCTLTSIRGNLCCGIRSKLDQSVLNEVMTGNAAFCYNSLTACFHIAHYISPYIQWPRSTQPSTLCGTVKWVPVEVIHPAVGCHYFPLGLQLPSQPQSIAPRPVPRYTALWQRHVGVNNLPEIVRQLLTRVGFEPTTCWSQVQRSTRCVSVADDLSMAECTIHWLRVVVCQPLVSLYVRCVVSDSTSLELCFTLRCVRSFVCFFISRLCWASDINSSIVIVVVYNTSVVDVFYSTALLKFSWLFRRLWQPGWTVSQLWEAKTSLTDFTAHIHNSHSSESIGSHYLSA